ncbi:hypothetical protein ACOME3_000681 [Neoechinorhynchus agilis]
MPKRSLHSLSRDSTSNDSFEAQKQRRMSKAALKDLVHKRSVGDLISQIDTLLCTVESDTVIKSEILRDHKLRFDFQQPEFDTHQYEKPPDEGTSHMVDLLFGNARAQKKQRMYYLREKHNASLLTSLGDSLKDVKSLGSTEVGDARMALLETTLPPFNLKATRCQDVYNISNIYGSESELEKYDELIMKTLRSEYDMKSECSYFQSHIEYIRKKIGPSLEFKDETDPFLRKSRLLFLFNNLMVLYRSSRNSTKDGQAFSRALRSLNTQCLAEFYYQAQDGCELQSGKLTTKLHNEAKLLNYLFILALTIDDYCTDTTFFAYDLQLPVFKVSNLFKAIGCSIDAKNNCNSATLKAPLQLNPYAFLTSSKMKRPNKDDVSANGLNVKSEPIV